jgi:hypothetical protein
VLHCPIEARPAAEGKPVAAASASRAHRALFGIVKTSVAVCPFAKRYTRDRPGHTPVTLVRDDRKVAKMANGRVTG